VFFAYFISKFARGAISMCSTVYSVYCTVLLFPGQQSTERQK